MVIDLDNIAQPKDIEEKNSVGIIIVIFSFMANSKLNNSHIEVSRSFWVVVDCK